MTASRLVPGSLFVICLLAVGCDELPDPPPGGEPCPAGPQAPLGAACSEADLECRYGYDPLECGGRTLVCVDGVFRELEHTDPSDQCHDQQPSADAGVHDFSCTTADDCTIKNVGNCCGYYPRCLNLDSPTPPPDCSGGQGSVCGWPDITHCECVENTCRSMQGDSEV